MIFLVFFAALRALREAQGEEPRIEPKDRKRELAPTREEN
jgi:hypothetical protein